MDGRIGQVWSHKGIERTLLRIRELPQDVYNRRKENIINSLLIRVQKKMPGMSKEDIQEYHDRIAGFLDEVRNMNDTDFMIKRDTLLKDYKEKLGFIPKKKPTPQQKIKRFLLSEEALKVLKEWHTGLKGRNNRSPMG